MSLPLGQQSSTGVGVGGDDFALQGLCGNGWRRFLVASPEGGGGMLLASTGRRPGVLLNIQQYTG